MSAKEEKDMLLMVAGQDRVQDLGRSISAEAQAMDNSALRHQISMEAAVLGLGQVDNESDYLTHQLEAFGMRTQLDLNKCPLPENSSGGLFRRIVGAVRNFVWRLVRFAFEWTIFHQNVINEQQAITLAHEVRLRRRENDELRKRIELLESKLAITEEVR